MGWQQHAFPVLCAAHPGWGNWSGVHAQALSSLELTGITAAVYSVLAPADPYGESPMGSDSCVSLGGR